MIDALDAAVRHLDWAGAVVGIAGAWMVGSQTTRGRWWGFAGFAASNLLLIAWAVYTKNWAIVTMQTFFLATSIRGLIANRPPAGPAGAAAAG